MNWIILDFGTHRLKALHAQIDNNKVRVLGWGEWKSQEEYFSGLGLPTAKAWAAMNIGLDELGWLDDQYFTLISALPSPYLETRYLKFPFKSEKKIERIIGMELEGSIPFDLEEVLIRFQVLEGEGVPHRKESLALGMLYKRGHIAQFENELRRFQVALPPVTTQNLALSTLRAGIPNDPLFGILQVGHKKTELVLTQDMGAILGSRTIWWGGDNVIKNMQTQLHVDYDTAAKVLESRATMEVSTSSNTESITVASSLEDSFNDLIAEIRQTLKSFHLGGLAIPRPLPIYVMGQPTKIQGMLSYIESAMEREFGVHLLPYPIENLADKYIEGLEILPDQEAALPALSVALAQTRIGRRVPVFSESSFQLQQNIRKLKSGSMEVAKRAALLLLAPFIFGVVHLVVQNQESKSVLAALSKSLEPAGIELDMNKSTNDLVKQLKRDRAQNLRQLDQLQEDASSPLVVLTKISKAIPQRLKLDVRELRITDSNIFLAAEVPSLTVQDEIVAALKKDFASIAPGKIDSCTSYDGCKTINLKIVREPKE